MKNKIMKAAYQSIYCFFKEDYFYRSSALTFSTMLAIVPIFVLIIFFLNFFPSFKNYILLSQNYFLEMFVPTAAMTVKHYITVFVNQAMLMPIESIIFLIITAVMLINTMEKTLNFIWKTTNNRRQIISIFFYGLIIILIPFIIGISLLVSSTFLNFYWVTKITKLLQLKFIIDFLFPILINTILFSLIYILVPNVKVIWRYSILSALITAFLFNLTRLGFVWYLMTFKSYSMIYGTFSIIPIFMMWLYIAWILIIWGALFAYYLQIEEKIN